jgi:NAD(P) transhydrogenase subunit alpha
VPGVERGKIAIIGGGVAGTYAAKAAVGMDAQVTLLDVNLNRLSYLEDVFGASVTTLYSTEANIRKCLAEADLVIGSVLIPGGSTPKLVRREHLKLMKPGSVIVDISIDQGGNCAITDPGETSVKHQVTIEGIKNIPGLLPTSSTWMFSHNIYNLVKYLAKDGTINLDMNDEIVQGIMTTIDGKIVHKGALEAMGA